MQNLSESKVRLDLFDNRKGLDRGKPFFIEILWYLIKIIFFLTPIPFPNKIKIFWLKLFGAKVGKGVVIKPRVNIHLPWKLKIGNNVWIGEEVFILNFENVEIGNNVCISQRVFLCGGNHNYKDVEMTYRNGSIILKDGCWVGATSFIAPNVSIGIDTVISAGSVVTKSLESNSIYSGNPLKYIKPRWQ